MKAQFYVYADWVMREIEIPVEIEYTATNSADDTGNLVSDIDTVDLKGTLHPITAHSTIKNMVQHGTEKDIKAAIGDLIAELINRQDDPDQIKSYLENSLRGAA